jgi:hypothetical protein
LARSDIDDELAELDRVAWSLETLRTHATNMACLLGVANLPSRADDQALHSK